MARRFYRSRNDAIVGGVCGGIADYVDTDPVFIRALFILFQLTGAPMFILYIILWFMAPYAPKERFKDAEEASVVTEE